MIKACLFDVTCILVSPSKNRMGGTGTMTDNNGSLDILESSGGVMGLTPGEEENRVWDNAKGYFDYDNSQMPDVILPGALDFLKDLYRHGIKLASTSTNSRAESILSSVGLYGMFSYIVNPESVAKRPDPEALLKAANHLGVDPSECVAFENTPEGIEAAKRAGMSSVAIGDLTHLYEATMGVNDLKGLTLLKLQDGLEARLTC